MSIICFAQSFRSTNTCEGSNPAITSTWSKIDFIVLKHKTKNFFRAASEKETNPQVLVDILKRDDLLSIYGFVYDLEQEEGGLSLPDAG